MLRRVIAKYIRRNMEKRQERTMKNVWEVDLFMKRRRERNY